MARSPVDQSRHVNPRQVLWTAIRARAEGFSLTDLGRVSLVNERTIRSYLDALLAGGFVQAVSEARPFVPKVYRLVKDTGIEAPRLKPDGSPVTMGASRDQMWRTMKIVATFTAADLAVQASTPECVVKEADALDYCKRLARAGYLVTVSGGRAGVKGRSTYRFLPTRDTGPLAPMVQRLKTVFDPNTGKIAWQEEPRP